MVVAGFLVVGGVFLTVMVGLAVVGGGTLLVVTVGRAVVVTIRGGGQPKRL